MKYRVIKELPFNPVGTILESIPGGIHIKDYHGIHSYSEKEVKILIQDGWLEEIKENKTVWDLKEGDEWYYIDPDTGRVVIHEWKNLLWQKVGRDLGNCFLTAQEAKKELSRMKARATIRKFIETNGLEKGECYPVVDDDFDVFSEHGDNKRNEYGLSREDCIKMTFDKDCQEALRTLFN